MKSLLTALCVLTIGTTTGNLSSSLNNSISIKNCIIIKNKKQAESNNLFNITLKKLEKLLIEKNNSKSELSLKLGEDCGVTKVEAPWYYFGTYEQVYLSEDVILNMESIEQTQDVASAIKYMLDILSSDYWAYVAMVSVSLPEF